jgi:hypothetical protein
VGGERTQTAIKWAQVLEQQLRVILPTWSQFSLKFNVFEFSLQKEGCVNVPHYFPIAFRCPLPTGDADDAITENAIKL